MSSNHPQTWYWTCACGKRAHPSRKTARAAARQVRRERGHAGPPRTVYRCHLDSSVFHFGHDGQRAQAASDEARIARTGSRRAVSPTRAPRHVAMREEKQ